MPSDKGDTDQLLQQVIDGDSHARSQLLSRHRRRLRALIALRLDRRLAGRVDPSDVVQESLVEADRRLPEYLRKRPLPFYPWLRRLALERLIDLQRLHIRSKKRSVEREQVSLPPLPDESMWELAQRLVHAGSGPGERLEREEQHARVREALAGLGERDRELLVLRHLEDLPVRDIAAILGITEGAVKVRHVRALQRLRRLLGDDFLEGQP